MLNEMPETLGADSAELLKSIFAEVGDAIMIAEVAADGPRIIYVNSAFTRMTGYRPAEVVGKSPRIFQGPGTSPITRAAMRDAIDRCEPVTVEVCNYRKDGSEYVAELSLSPVFGRAGSCAHWVSIQRDITQRRLAEEARTVTRIAEEKRLAVLDERRERERIAERLAYAAAHDDLTGLYTRSYFIGCLTSAIARSAFDPECRYELLLIDLDRFKLVNDHVGHRTGDLILRDLARRFERLVGTRDVLARLGGDEFGLLHECTAGAPDTVQIARDVLAEVSSGACDFVVCANLSASVGIVEFTPDITDPEVLLRDAEIAVEQALREGGGTAVIVTPQLRATAAAAQRIRYELAGVAERGELRLFYQPLVDIALGRVYGLEGLVRWQHPVHGLIPPDDFIPAAEEDGHIGEIGRWVLAEGCRKAVEFQSRSGLPILMSLNVSSAQILDPRFFVHLQSVLQSTGLDPRSLQLEITESAFLAGGSAVGALFSRVRGLGVKVAFDDFGTGYSSLSYLERYQIDSLKIDRSFVERIHDASAKSEILRMIIALAHALGVDVIAEGVEYRAQRDALGKLGCTHLQGFLFSRPQPEARIMELLRSSSASSELETLLAETLTGKWQLSETERCELREQIDAAIEKHLEKMQLMQRAVATGEVPPNIEHVGADDQCSIGIWLSSTISPRLRNMPLYHAARSRHAVFHRSMARLYAAVAAGRSEAAQSLRPDGDVSMVADSLLRTLADWRAVADQAPRLA